MIITMRNTHPDDNSIDCCTQKVGVYSLKKKEETMDNTSSCQMNTIYIRDNDVTLTLFVVPIFRYRKYHHGTP